MCGFSLIPPLKFRTPSRTGANVIVEPGFTHYLKIPGCEIERKLENGDYDVQWNQHTMQVIYLYLIVIKLFDLLSEGFFLGNILGGSVSLIIFDL